MLTSVKQWKNPSRHSWIQRSLSLSPPPTLSLPPSLSLSPLSPPSPSLSRSLSVSLTWLLVELMETRDGLAFPPQKRSRRPPTWPGATLTSQSRLFHASCRADTRHYGWFKRYGSRATARDAHGRRLRCSATAIPDKNKVRKGFRWIWDLICKIFFTR